MIKLQKIYFPDRRTTDIPIFGVHFVNGWAQEYTSPAWLHKFEAVGSTSPYEIREEVLYTADEYDKLKEKYEELKKKKVNTGATQ